MDDKQAILRLKQGDISSLEVLVKRYQVPAVRTANMILRDQSLAQDVVHSAFLKVYNNIHKFKDELPFRPWFFKIVVNDAVKMAKAQSKLSSLDAEYDDDAQVLARWMKDPLPLPETQVETQETVECLRNAMQLLTPEQRATAIMYYYLDLDEKEIAIHLDKPVSTVKWWMRAARKRLAQLLKPAGN